MNEQITGGLFKRMILHGAAAITAQKQAINDLNVFPVPDGDTGTNMSMTIAAAVTELKKSEPAALDQAVSITASALLRGARGNSGVILSLLFRGLSKGLKGRETADAAAFAAAMQEGVSSAYKAVMKPKEGTILTVARGAAEKAQTLVEDGCSDMETFLSTIIAHAEYVLSQTPEMLPVLKQAGVVDSGGQGLITVLSGALDAFLGKELDLSIKPSGGTGSGKVSGQRQTEAQMEIKFGYCTEFIIMLNKTFNIKTEMDFKAYLESIGDSIVCVADDGVVKVHVHTNDPGLAIQKALQYGALSNMKIDNMRLEHQEKLFKMAEKEEGKADGQESGKSVQTAEAAADAPPKDFGFIAVSVGEGINEIFRSLGVDYIIEGGQTMDPSTADILDAVDKVNAKTIFILPNNKNIILAANQAAELTAEKDLFVIPTKTIPQGITAVINFVPELSVEDMLQSTPPEPEVENIDVETKSDTRKLVEKFVDENPEAAANLLRNWLNEDWS